MGLDALSAAIVVVEDNIDLLAQKASDLAEPAVTKLARDVAANIADNVAQRTAIDVATSIAEKHGSETAKSVAERVSTELLPSEVETYLKANPPKPGRDGVSIAGKQGDPGIPGIVWRGPFVRGTLYQANDAVEFEGSSYIATRATKATPPTKPWQLLSRKGRDGQSWFGGGGSATGGGANLSNDTPLIEAGLGSPGVGTEASRDDHVHPAAAGSGTPSATVESETTYGISPAAGASNDYSRGDHTHGSPATPTAASVGAAPSTVDYLVGTASAGLSAEIVVGTTPGGELGNTWASPTVDTTHSGSSHAGVVSAHEAAANPHPGYLTQAEGDAAYDVIGAAAAVAANAVNDGDAAGGDLSGTYPNPSVVNDSHSHTAATLPASTLGFVSQARWFTD